MASNFYPDADLAGEPSLDELLAEPIVQLFMQRDGVKAHTMRDALDRVLRAYSLDTTIQ